MPVRVLTMSAQAWGMVGLIVLSPVSLALGVAYIRETLKVTR